MKSNFKIDDIYKDKFEYYEANFDKEYLWKELVLKLKKKRKRRVIIFLILIMVALVYSGYVFSLKGEGKDNNIPHLKKMRKKNIDIPAINRTLPEDNKKEIVNRNIEKSKYPDQKKSKNYNTNERDDSKFGTKTALVKNTIYDNIDFSKKSFDLVKTVKKPFPKILNIQLLDVGLFDLKSKNKFSLSTTLIKKQDDWSKNCLVKKNNRFYLLSYLSVLFPNQNITGFNENNEYAKLWEKYDSVLLGYSAGLMIGYEFVNGLNIESGVEYQQAFEKLMFYQKVTETIKIYSDSIYYWQDEIGKKHFIGDTTETNRTYERKVQSLKRHTLFNIPLFVGYNFKFKRLKFGIQSGILFNIKHVFKGMVVTPEGNFNYLNKTSQNDVYKLKIGLSYLVNFKTDLFTNKHVNWYVALGLRINNNSWLKNDTRLKLTNNFSGLKIGIKYFL